MAADQIRGGQGQMYPPTTGSPPGQATGYGHSPPPYGYEPPTHGVPMQNYHPNYGQPLQQPMQISSQQQQTNVVIIEQPKVSTADIELAPRDYTATAVLVTLFCCLPLGIAAIVSASNANTYTRQLNMHEAHIWANRARILIIVSIVCGVSWIITLIAIEASVVSSY